MAAMKERTPMRSAMASRQISTQSTLSVGFIDAQRWIQIRFGVEH